MVAPGTLPLLTDEDIARIEAKADRCFSRLLFLSAREITELIPEIPRLIAVLRAARAEIRSLKTYDREDLL